MSKQNEESIVALRKEFGARGCTLNTGAPGIRGGMACNVRDLGTDNGEPVLEFIGSDNTVDRYNEVISPEAWGDMKNFRANPVIPDCHDYSSVLKILGRADRVEVRDGKLVNDVRFCIENPMGNIAYKMAKGGFIKSQSVGFIPMEWTNGNAAGQPDRTYTKCELMEISLVVVPANPGATVGLALKAGVIERRDFRELADYLKQFCGDEKQTPDALAGASGAGVYDAQLLQIARGVAAVLKRS